MFFQSRSKGLYRVTMETETEPNYAMEKAKYFNRLDEAFGMLCLGTSRELLFHIEILSTLNEFWVNFESLLGNIDEMKGHHLENELISLSLDHYETIEDFFTKFEALVLQLKQCGIENKYDHIIFSILSNIRPEYSVFVSTFHSSKLTARNWRMPTLEDFMDSLN